MASDRLSGRVEKGATAASSSGGLAGAQPARSAPTPNPGAVVTGSAETIAIGVRPGAGALKAGTMTVRVGEREVGAPLWYVYPELAPGNAAPAESSLSAHVREWIGTSVVWRTSRNAPKESPTSGEIAGFWVAVIVVPEGTDASSVAVDGRAVEVGDWGAEAPRIRRTATSAFAREMLAGLRRSPMVRWRARLAAGEPLVSDHAPDSFADATLEALARTTERHWAGVLGRLNAANAELASRFASRLAGVVDIGEGVEIPVWPADANTGVAMETLLADLTRAGADAERLARVAEAWLGAQPVGGAVVVDDAAAVDLKTGLTFPSVLLANLSEQPVAARATRAETVEPEMLRVEPFSAVFASVGAAARVDESMDPRRKLGLEAMRNPRAERTMAEVVVGEWRGARAVVGEVAKIRPPGMEVGPLLADWTQQTFLAAAMDTTARGEMQLGGGQGGFVGRLKPSDDQGAGNGGGTGRWIIMFEMTRASAPMKEDRSELVLSFGPRGGGNSQTLRVLPDGSLFEVRNGQAFASGKAVVSASGPRTLCWVPVPSAAIEGGKVLRLGLVRIDERGRRSAWPRPMLPWQTEPGRVAVDLSSWGPGRE